MDSKELERYVNHITKLRLEANHMVEDNPGSLIKKIDTLSKCLVYIGRVSAFLDGEYKRVYAKRKYEHALAMTLNTKKAEAHAELAVHQLRMEEAEVYQDSRRWRNAFSSTQEEIHALKLKMKVDFATEVSNHNANR